jgi:uncharacterized protein YjbI with pentapeptide repeats
MNKVNGYEIKPCADLRGADLRNADLSDADLRNANLRNADLMGANLMGANLMGTKLRNANLMDAYLRYAHLRYANLIGANLMGADLRNANLMDTKLRNAKLMGADLMDADLRYCIGNNQEIKTLQLDAYQVTYTSSVMAIGCQQHTIVEWFEFTDADIFQMDEDTATRWCDKYSPILETIFKTQGIKTT